jgi:hypothetical protein
MRLGHSLVVAVDRLVFSYEMFDQFIARAPRAKPGAPHSLSSIDRWLPHVIPDCLATRRAAHDEPAWAEWSCSRATRFCFVIAGY